MVFLCLNVCIRNDVSSVLVLLIVFCRIVLPSTQYYLLKYSIWTSSKVKSKTLDYSKFFYNMRLVKFKIWNTLRLYVHNTILCNVFSLSLYKSKRRAKTHILCCRIVERANNHVFILVLECLNYNSCECNLWNNFSIHLSKFVKQKCDKHRNFMIEIHHAAFEGIN